jgi:hypothetical protein
MEGSLGWALDCWPYGKMMSAKDSDPDCVKLDPDCVGPDPDLVSAELAGQGAPGGGQGSLERRLESLGGVAMEAGRLRRPAQQGGGAWRLLGVSRRLERQVGR